MNVMLWLAGLVLVLSVSLSFSEDFHPLSDAFIDFINSKQSTWQAGRNFHESTPISQIEILLGAWNGTNSLSERTYVDSRVMVPDSFDAREQWPECPTIGHIQDQSNCGSCWAMSTAGAISDRYCIKFDAKLKVTISAANLMACCKGDCDGCNGALISTGWDHWVNHGIVTGGDYDSGEGCITYPCEPCEHYGNGSYPACETVKCSTPECVSKCDRGSEVHYQGALYYGKEAYKLKGEEDMKTEILTHGPVQARFFVYEDFLSYKSGVYQHVTGNNLGSHAVKVLGWGEENGTPYWLMANSWNEHWGDKGYFKILRGQNHCFCEGDVAAGLPYPYFL